MVRAEVGSQDSGSFPQHCTVYNTYKSSMYLMVSSAKLQIYAINCIYLSYTLLTKSLHLENLLLSKE